MAGGTEVKSDSQSIRFVIAGHSPQQISKVGPATGLWEKGQAERPASSIVDSLRSDSLRKHSEIALFFACFASDTF